MGRFQIREWINKNQQIIEIAPPVTGEEDVLLMLQQQQEGVLLRNENLYLFHEGVHIIPQEVLQEGGKIYFISTRPKNIMWSIRKIIDDKRSITMQGKIKVRVENSCRLIRCLLQRESEIGDILFQEACKIYWGQHVDHIIERKKEELTRLRSVQLNWQEIMNRYIKDLTLPFGTSVEAVQVEKVIFYNEMLDGQTGQ